RPGTAYTLALRGLQDPQGANLAETYLTFTTLDKKDAKENDAAARHSAAADRAADSSAGNLPPLKAPPGVTALAGQALTLDGKALEGVTVRIDEQSAKTDGTGRFLLARVPPGHHEMVIDGRTVRRPGETYGVFEVGVNLAGGQTTVLNYTVWMTPLDTAHAVNVPFPTTAEVVVATPLLPGLEFHIPPNTTITDIDGKAASQISITPIPVRQPPFPLPPGVAVPIYFTIQPGGGYITVANTNGTKGARLIYPNAFNQPAGTRFDFWNYDADEKGWFVYGHGSVSPNRQSIIPDPGVEIYELTGAMVAGGGYGPAKGPCPQCTKKAGDPVDLATGLFVYEKTDLVLPDLVPLALTRTYRQDDNRSRAFGIGTTHNYDIFLTGAIGNYTYQELVLADGGRVRFDRISPGTSWGDAVYQSISSPGEFYGAKIVWNGNGWTLTDSSKNDVVLWQDNIAFRQNNNALERVTLPHGWRSTSG
ncbi:MAG: hypothetical protein DMG12_24820, partial [Acidobacteria bacterium]